MEFGFMMDESLFGVRDKRGHWRPFRRVKYPPLFTWPVRIRPLLAWIFRWNGYIYPYNLLYAVVGILVWTYLTPDLSTMQSFGFDWVLFILLRNAGIMTLWYGLFHLRLYIVKGQGTAFKYNPKWPETDSSGFLFRNQTIDNLIWCYFSALPLWTAYEAATLWMMANGFIPVLAFTENPVLFVALFFAIPLFREVHFYFIHRLIHWPPLYRACHKVHHANSNPGPWSGLSMHPGEHLIYFSSVLLHWIVPSNPVHVVFHMVHLTMSPPVTHSGFEKVVLDDGKAVDTNALAHYLHHKYFEVNYSDGAVPLDKWFGSFHDGSPEGDKLVQQRLRHLKARSVK